MPRIKSVSVAAVRRGVAKQLPLGTKLDPQSWSVKLAPGSLLVKAASKVSVDTAIFDADAVDIVSMLPSAAATSPSYATGLRLALLLDGKLDVRATEP